MCIAIVARFNAFLWLLPAATLTNVYVVVVVSVNDQQTALAFYSFLFVSLHKNRSVQLPQPWHGSLHTTHKVKSPIKTETNKNPPKRVCVSVVYVGFCGLLPKHDANPRLDEALLSNYQQMAACGLSTTCILL